MRLSYLFVAIISPAASRPARAAGTGASPRRTRGRGRLTVGVVTSVIIIIIIIIIICCVIITIMIIIISSSSSSSGGGGGGGGGSSSQGEPDHLMASRRGQDKRGHHRSAAISPNFP